MSILDQIANTQAPNFLENLRVMQNIETSRLNRRMAEVQAGQALQELQMKRQALTQRQQGQEVIQQFLGRGIQRETQPQSGIGPPMPVTTPTGEQQLIPAPAPAPTEPPKQTIQASLRPVFKAMQGVPTNELERATTLQNLSDVLATMPGNEPLAEMYYGLSEKAMERAQKQTKDERESAELLYEMTGNNFQQISKLEEQGRFAEAKNLFDQTTDFILSDPRFENNEDVQRFYKGFNEYQPGIGKFLYTTTMYGKKARDQFQKEQPTQTKYDTLNLYWSGLDRPVAGRFNTASNNYEYKKDGQWVPAPDNAEVMGRTTIQGTADEVGLTKSDVSKINQQIIADDLTLGLIDNVVQGIEANPQAIGFVGNVKEVTAGLTGQFGSYGAEIASMIESDDEVQVRSGIRMLTGLLIPRVLNDTSGRYSDKDQERVDQINRGLKNVTSPQQAITALKEVQQIIKLGQNASNKMLGRETPDQQYSDEDIKFTAKKYGISEEEVKRKLGIQ